MDITFKEDISDPHKLAADLKHIVGVVEHGLFCGMAKTVIVAGDDGTCRVAGDQGVTEWWSGDNPS